MLNRPDKKKSHWRGFSEFCVKLILAWILFIVLTETVFAISNPTSISIVDVKAYDAVLEADDL